MKSKKRYGSADKQMKGADPFTRNKEGKEGRQNPFTKAEFRPGIMHSAIQEACDWLEKRKEFEAQHGPVRVLWKDGKPVSPDGEGGGGDDDD